jgi:hypothetical protein
MTINQHNSAWLLVQKNSKFGIFWVVNERQVLHNGERDCSRLARLPFLGEGHSSSRKTETQSLARPASLVI